MRKKRLRHIERKKISKECWSLDYSFYVWLNTHLKVYKQDAMKAVDLYYHRPIVNGEEQSLVYWIDRMIELSGDLAVYSLLDIKDFEAKRELLCDIFKVTLPYLWW